MKCPSAGELTSTEQIVYDLVVDAEVLEISPTTANLARALGKDKELVAAVCDGLEAMGFIRRYGGIWHPDYTD